MCVCVCEYAYLCVCVCVRVTAEDPHEAETGSEDWIVPTQITCVILATQKHEHKGEQKTRINTYSEDRIVSTQSMREYTCKTQT
jgi:hypothetical protein